MAKRQEVVQRSRGLYKNGRLWWVRTVRDPMTGRSVSLSTGTADLKRANQILAMLEIFAQNPRYDHSDWLTKLVNREQGVTLESVYLHWESHELHLLRLKLDALKNPTMQKLRAQWEGEWIPMQKWPERRVQQHTNAVRYFIPDVAEGELPLALVDFTPDYIRQCLADLKGAAHDRMADASEQTKTHYVFALTIFCRWAEEQVPAFVDPMRKVKRPKRSVARMRYYEHGAIQRLLAHVDNPAMRACLALMFGAGMEWAACENLTPALVSSNKHERIVYAVGTKNDFRRRPVVVDAWAYKIFDDYLTGAKLAAHDRVFTFALSRLRRAFYNAQVTAGLIATPPLNPKNHVPQWHKVDVHRMHDCRHSFAVNRAFGLDGEPPCDTAYVSANLGHADETMVTRVYKRLRVEERHRLSAQSKAMRQSEAAD